MKNRSREHLAQQIRQKLSAIILKEAGDARLAAVTLTAVRFSKDKAYATISFSSYLPDANPEELELRLNKAAGFFGHLLGRSLTTRNTPKLHFKYDHGFDYADQIDRVLREVRPEGGGPQDEAEEDGK